jgi:hypothetical protein
LAALLTYCTEEHPFVVQARRELAELEARMPTPEAPPPVGLDQAERRRRLSAIQGELTAAQASNRVLVERRRRQTEVVEERLATLTLVEKDLYSERAALASLETVPPPPAAEGDLSQNLRDLALTLVAVARGADETPRPVETPASPPPTQSQPQLRFAPLLEPITLRQTPLSPLPLQIGWGVGLFLAFLWLVLHELLDTRLTGAYLVRHLVNLPLLAVLPAYDEKSLAAAALAEGGGLAERSGRHVYIPRRLDLEEPPLLGKRRPLAPRRRHLSRRPFVLALTLALVVLALGLANWPFQPVGEIRLPAIAQRFFIPPGLPADFDPGLWSQPPTRGGETP